MLRTISLGRAWSASTVNTVIFRHHGLITYGRFQFSAFYVNPRAIRVVRRDLMNGSICTSDIPGVYNLADAHNSISIGCDREGFLHLSYDHHASNLRYRRSKAPLAVDEWAEEFAMTGRYEDNVTYPAFVSPEGGRPLLLLYRDGVWNKGSVRLKEYSEATQTWKDRDEPILSGAGDKPWTSNAYLNHPVVDRDGSIHLSFVWRTNSLGAEQRINNVNIGYTRSDILGCRWVSSRGRSFQLPITPVSAETVFAVSPGSNLINQCGMALDSNGRPHIVFYSDNADSIPQYQHLWFDGSQWRHAYISRRTEPFVLRGAGTLQIPMSRPDIVIDDNDYVYVIYRADVTGDRMVAQRLMPPDYQPRPDDVRVLWDSSVGHSEPVIDRHRWRRDRILSMLMQKNYQPPHDKPVNPMFDPVYIVERQLSLLFHGI